MNLNQRKRDFSLITALWKNKIAVLLEIICCLVEGFIVSMIPMCLDLLATSFRNSCSKNEAKGELLQIEKKADD